MSAKVKKPARVETLTDVEKIGVKALVAVLCDMDEDGLDEDNPDVYTDDFICDVIDLIEFDGAGLRTQRKALGRLRRFAEAHGVTLLQLYWEACS